ncbi:putative alpha-L-arabinofuranosidase A [Mycena kentingensis (nom. inval.)]|nr:putative alpha-L-arabinofuranosidase A [Mycena kentingensis (nom. inval.)]
MYLFLLQAAALLPGAFAATTVSVTSATASHPIPTTLYTATALNAWVPLGGASIAVVADSTPLSSALPNSLALTIPAGTTDELGFANTGFWGINLVQGTEYTASLNYRVASPLTSSPTLTISLLAADGTILASHSTKIESADGWTEVSAVLIPNATPASTANRFAVTITDASEGVEVHFALLSLFPPTFKGRKNGMRVDIAEALAEMRPAFFRFPGGNNLEGQTTATRWQWRKTLGPLSERPGRQGDWTYPNTDGLGLLEYLLWCEDLDMEPFMAINFVIGDPATNEAAALRASLGHPEPFKLRFVEIGNEDFVGQAPGTVASRWKDIVTNLTATFPQLKFMASSRVTGPVLTPTPEVYDAHVYQTPRWFSQNSFIYDVMPRNGMLFFEGEYASTSTNSSNLFGTPEQGRLLWPTVAAAVGEAAFMMGFERNADIVFAASYAPLLGHVNGSQWTPNLRRQCVQVDELLHPIGKSLFYYSPSELMAITIPDNTTAGTLFWSVTRWTETNELIIKVCHLIPISNNAATSQDLVFLLPFDTVSLTGQAVVLTGVGTSSNTPEMPDLIVPVTSQIPTGKELEYTAPGMSFTVITNTHSIMLPLLPIELWALTFQYADVQTLLSLCLSCRLLGAVSIDLLVRNLRWSSPGRALEHVSTFWTRFPDKSRLVRSLSLDFHPDPRQTPPLQSRPANDREDWELHTHVFEHISTFRTSLLELCISGIALPSTFFQILNALPRLSYLNVRQSIVPPAPDRLSSPAPLQRLVMVYLSPRSGGAYSAYFVHLFPEVPTLFMDRYPEPGPGSSGRASNRPVSLMLGHSFYSPDSRSYLATLRNFDLSHLRDLEVTIPDLYFPPFRLGLIETLPNATLPLTLPRLQRVFAPFAIVKLAVLGSGSGLTHVAVQGVVQSSSLALELVELLSRRCDALSSLAFSLQSWDDEVIATTAAVLGSLQSLEVLYYNDDPSVDIVTKYLPQLPMLTELFIHRFSFPDAALDILPSRYGKWVPSSRAPPSTILLMAAVLQTSESQSLLRIRLWGKQTLIREDIAAPWCVAGEEERSCGWTYIFPVAAAVTVSVSATASHPMPTTLWGQMFEDISSGDGGLYAELLQNRAFQQVTPNTAAALTAWSAVNGAFISVIADPVPVSSALPNSLQVQIPTGRTGPVGVANSGYFGIKVTGGATYTASFHYRFPTASSFRGTATVALQTTAGVSLVSTTVALSAVTTAWQTVSVTLRPANTAASTNNRFVVTLDGPAAAGQRINFAMFSLFPPTFKNRANGMRADVAQALADMRPAFFRFPGGNNLGQTIPQRWQWNATVGHLVNRPGRLGDWGYINTDGLGLKDYLDWCEDLGMKAIMAVWSGFSLDGTSIAEADLGPYIQQAIDQINFVIGDPAKSAPAALRASLGHPAPYPLISVEIGNEDFFQPTTYSYRWNHFFTTLKATFPALEFLATTQLGNPVLSPKPPQYDLHVYQTPTWFAQNSFMYDNIARDGTMYFEGEYAAISTNSSDIFGTPEHGRLTFPTMQSAAGEAAFMTGLERNADIVFAASYAPLLNHLQDSQWTPNLVSFERVIVLDYYVQKLFSLNRGDEYLPSTLPTPNGTIFWSVVRKVATQQIIIKVSNTIATANLLTFVLPFGTVATQGSLQVLTGAATASNTPTAPNAVVPRNGTLTTGKTFTYNAPGISVSVITLVAH